MNYLFSIDTNYLFPYNKSEETINKNKLKKILNDIKNIDELSYHSISDLAKQDIKQAIIIGKQIKDAINYSKKANFNYVIIKKPKKNKYIELKNMNINNQDVTEKIIINNYFKK